MPAKDLEARIQLLEDIEAIRKLKAKYIYFMDAVVADPKNGPWQELADLFAKDAKFKFPDVGEGRGRDAIIKFYTVTHPTKFPFIIHMIHSPLIEVKGNSATGKWYLQTSCTLGSTGQAVWGAATYEDEFTKVVGEWKFSSIEVKMIFATPYNQGWNKATEALST